MIAKQKTPHTIGEELLKPRVLKATQIILGEDTEQQIKSVTLTNNLVKRIIDDIAADIKSQVYVRYISGNIIEEDILYNQSSTAGPTSEYIFNSVSNYVEKNNLDWSKLFGFCINRASAMIGVRLGLDNGRKK
nr:unnamed protein product [Callosobruchus analis]